MGIIRQMDSVCKLYLIAHVVIALLFDSQTGAGLNSTLICSCMPGAGKNAQQRVAVLPHTWYPQLLLDAVDGYANLGDDLVRGAPPWFKSLVWMEILLQIPLSVFLIWAYHTKAPSLRWAAVSYSMHVLTTMPPIIAHFVATMEPPHIWCVLSIYSPWIIFPVFILLRFWWFPKTSTRPITRRQPGKTKDL